MLPQLLLLVAQAQRGLAPSSGIGVSGPPATFRCSAGLTIPNSNRASATFACSSSARPGAECKYTCDPGHLRIGRHVCQNYSTMGVPVIDRAFFGGRCERLCGASVKEWSCAAPLVPVRMNASDAGGACLSTTCLSRTEALERLARGNYEVWRRGRHNRTGMYTDHVNPLLSHDGQQWLQASADGAGPGLAIECVAASLGYISLDEAAQRVLLTLHSFAGATPGFHDPRNEAEIN